VRFKTDENLPVEAAVRLRDSGFDALTVVDQSLQGDSDSNLASICQAESRALITLDLDFADVRSYPPEAYPGLIVLRPRNQAKATVLSLIATLIPLLAAERLAGNLWILQEAGLRIREGQRKP
jgi:predicted nuclease of predicted toxin-antitoxin system